jgi:hypothetical protein
VVVGAQPRAVAARALTREDRTDDIVDDLRELAARYGVRLPRVELRWPIAGIVGLGCGLLAAAGHAQEFNGSITLGAIAASAIIVAGEALMVLVGYALFGGYLGISPSGHRNR